MTSKPLTIQQKVEQLINYNPLALLFVLDAIDARIKSVLKDEQQTLSALENSFVGGAAWIATAKDIEKTLWPS